MKSISCYELRKKKNNARYAQSALNFLVIMGAFASIILLGFVLTLTKN